MNAPPLGAVIIVVPVHNEGALLGRCLESLARAIEETSLPCVVRVVLDACTDESAQIAAQHPFPVLRIDANAVGAARARGIESALDALAGFDALPTQRVWITTTDADSSVPANWITVQREHADAGADLVLGTVRPDFADLAPAHREYWLQTHQRGAPAGNTHGANLGVRASTYRAAGGFADLELDEDVAFVEACRVLGAHIAVTDDAEVITSGRVEGRVSGGYADYLRALAPRFAGRTDMVSEGGLP